MTKQEKQHLELIVYRMDEADKRVVIYIKSSKPIYKSYIQISNLSKKIYSIPKQDYGQKPNKTQHLERILQCGEVLLVVELLLHS
jgi:hypothetical protein